MEEGERRRKKRKRGGKAAGKGLIISQSLWVKHTCQS